MTQSTEIKYIECLCSEQFRTAEDYRDHLPCPAAETAQKAKAAFEALERYGFKYKNRVWVPPVNEAAHRARMLRHGLEQIFALAAETLREVGGMSRPITHETLNDYIRRQWVERGGCRVYRDDDGRHCLKLGGHEDPCVFEVDDPSE